MDIADFMALPTEKVAQLVRQAGPQVCVFPINGTRRWFVIEHSQNITGDPVQAYIDISARNHIALYQLLFEHGIDTLITPTFGADILERGGYMECIGVEAYARLVTGPDFLQFYDSYGIRAHFYGDYHRALAVTPFSELSSLFDSIAVRTKGNSTRRLFFGAFANDATDAIARATIEIFNRTGHAPDRRALVEAYYGEYVEPATLFIGFDKPSVYDYPLLNLGSEDLYFTVAPSPYLNARTLRRILYDHLFARQVQEQEWMMTPASEIKAIGDFYRSHAGSVIGVGNILHGTWIPHIEEDTAP